MKGFRPPFSNAQGFIPQGIADFIVAEGLRRCRSVLSFFHCLPVDLGMAEFAKSCKGDYCGKRTRWKID